jgi:hypothetical protein
VKAPYSPYAGGMETPTATPKRRPGGQPGNQNARKHGFYAHALSQDEQPLLQRAAQLDGLQSELALLRATLLGVVRRPDPPYAVLMDMTRLITRMVSVQRRISARRKPSAGRLHPAESFPQKFNTAQRPFAASPSPQTEQPSTENDSNDSTACASPSAPSTFASPADASSPHAVSGPSGS